MSDNDEAREFLESCYQRKKTVINPIINWEDEDVWEFIHKYDVPYCSLYDQGEKRLGCIGCPLSGSRKQKADFEKYPKYKAQYIRSFDKMLQRFTKEEREKLIWETAEDVYEWWISKKAEKPIEGQLSIDL